jgi:hypothetical protein
LTGDSKCSDGSTGARKIAAAQKARFAHTFIARTRNVNATVPNLRSYDAPMLQNTNDPMTTPKKPFSANGDVTKRHNCRPNTAAPGQHASRCVSPGKRRPSSSHVKSSSEHMLRVATGDR